MSSIDPLAVLKSAASANPVGLDFYRKIEEVHINVLGSNITIVYSEWYETGTGYQLSKQNKTYIIKNRWDVWVAAIGAFVLTDVDATLLDTIPLDAENGFMT